VKKSELSIDLRKKYLIKAMEKTLCNVAVSCKKVGITRQTYYNYYDNDEVFRTKIDNLKEMQIDFVESKLLKLVNEESAAAIFFYLNNKAKKRGYNERKEVDITSNGANINTEVKMNEKQFNELTNMIK